MKIYKIFVFLWLGILGYGHSSHCNSYKLQNKILNSCDFLYTENARNKIYEDLLKDYYNF